MPRVDGESLAPINAQFFPAPLRREVHAFTTCGHEFGHVGPHALLRQEVRRGSAIMRLPCAIAGAERHP